jgi:hypothetical protein
MQRQVEGATTKMILGADIGPGEIRCEANTAGLAHTHLGKVMSIEE